ncbi:unnamed protein product [Cuscuta epithymum]|uniref:Uncharacterized protein n=1 Tax=Cuscuta epithymum TaxID=186058 RepID=A0AAV0FK01_9ASTE|nr:unnamed protein product [Cuscuta epithymum]
MAARFSFVCVAILGMLVMEAMAAGSADSETYPRRLLLRGTIAAPPVPGGPVSGSGERRVSGEEAEAPESLAAHHHYSKSVAGGEVIIGGLVTALFAAVYCYIRVTRRRVDGDQRSVY